MLGSLVDRATNVALLDLPVLSIGYGQVLQQDSPGIRLLSGSYNAPVRPRPGQGSTVSGATYNFAGRVEALLHQQSPAPTAIHTAPAAKEAGDIWALLDELTGSVSGPEDWALEHDHYIHGTPKRRQH